jgi:hypothetical protein
MSKLPWWLKLCLQILLMDLVIAILILGWSWFTKDFSTVSLSNRFFIGGVLAILISLGSGMGNFENRSDWRQMYAQSAGQANLTERTNRMIADIAQVYALAFVLMPAGLIAILIAVMIG